MNTLIYTVQIMNMKRKEEIATLEILQVIENKRDVTQRHLADRLDVALGLTNSYLKRSVRKGLVKIQQAPANRYFYYLTPQGFAEKSRLTAQYLSTSFDFYRQASDSLRKVFEKCHENDWNEIVFCGISELAEIASLRVNESGLTHVATYQPDSELEEFLRKPVWHELTEEVEMKAVVLTSLDNSEELYREINQKVEKEKILIPTILGIKI